MDPEQERQSREAFRGWMHQTLFYAISVRDFVNLRELPQQESFALMNSEAAAVLSEIEADSEAEFQNAPAEALQMKVRKVLRWSAAQVSH